MSYEKVNKALGIDSIDDFLKDLDVEDPNIGKMGEVDENVKANIEKIDSNIKKYNNGDLENVDMAEIRDSLDGIKDLINVSKSVIRHTHEAICQSELLDPDVIHAFSTVLESAHITIAEYINLYRDRMAFYDKVRLKMIDFEHKKELMRMKYELDAKKNASKVKDVTDSSTFVFSQEDIVKTLETENEEN